MAAMIGEKEDSFKLTGLKCELGVENQKKVGERQLAPAMNHERVFRANQ
jgi:hypothetical protein